jgi:steroid 5-alpha reductase family enzyme
MYDVGGPSTAQRLTLAALGASWVALAWWLLFGGGLSVVGAWFGWRWQPGDVVRRACLAVALTIYYVRGFVAIALFLLGSWMNTFAEYARYRWKQRPENRGKLYTKGLFRYSRHPNYLGDLLSFSGLCLMAGAWVTAVIPIAMLAGFVFVNVPVLDAHLQERYGSAFGDYARRTRKLIPFLY